MLGASELVATLGLRIRDRVLITAVVDRTAEECANSAPGAVHGVVPIAVQLQTPAKVTAPEIPGGRRLRPKRKGLADLRKRAQPAASLKLDAAGKQPVVVVEYLGNQ